MSLLLQGGSANIADVQFEGGAGNKTVVIPKEGGKLAVGTMLSGATAYHLLQGDLSVSNEVITKGFSTVLYTSGGATTGVNMIARWGNDASETFGGLVWLKDRVEATNNFLYDTVRGTTKGINSNTTEAEATLAGGLTAFNSTGFTVGADAGHNSTTNNMVSWNFQTTHRRTGTTNHGKAFTEHYNPFTGFTIIKYEGSGLSGHDIPHALGRKLGFVTTKNLTTAVNWLSQFDINQQLSLNTTDALGNPTNTISSLTDTQCTVNIASNCNTSANQYIMYGWANSYFDESNKLIGNYEIGVYGGTGAAGNKVTTRGKPAWIMVKRLDGTSDWAIKDNLRGSTKLLYANASVAEETDQNVDFSVDGFIIQNTNTDMNTSGGQYLYMVVYDNDSGSGKSKYPRATDSSNLTINNAIIPFAQGIDSNGTKVSTLSKNETITGLTYNAGKNYVYAKVDGTYGVTKHRPRYLEMDLIAEKAGDNPDYFDVLKNKWFSTVASSELVTNGTFDVDTSGWTAGNSGTLSVVNNTLKITNGAATNGWAYQAISTEIGKKYKLNALFVGGTAASGQVYIGTTSGNSDIYTALFATGTKISVEFVSQSLLTYIRFDTASSTNGAVYSYDNISVYAADLELNVPITARNYLDIIAYADASGQLTYVKELVKTQYFDRIETSGNRKVMYLADYGIAQIQNNKRYVLDNPFGNDRYMDCDTKVEIFYNNRWAEPKWDGNSGSSGNAYGVSSGSLSEGIVIQTGATAVRGTCFMTGSLDGGANESPISAPARVTIQFNGKTGRTR